MLGLSANYTEEPVPQTNPTERTNVLRGRRCRGGGRRLPITAAFAFAAALLGGPARAAEPGYTLDQCYRFALERSKTVAGQVQLIQQAEARINQTRAAFLPSVDLAGTVLRQQTPTSPLAQSIFPADQETVRATATQNLFKGFRDLATLEQRKLARRAAEFARDQAEVQLYLDVAQAFYDVLGRQSDLRNYADEIGANEDRRRELLQFKRTARARETDIATVEAAIATLQASVANTQGLLDAARETLSFLTGLPRAAELSDSEAFPSGVPALDFWLARVLSRPDVDQAQSNLEAARKNTEVARGGAGPTLDLSANYYFRRPGINEDINWDVQLSVTQPLFTGGLVQAQVREALSQQQANEITLEQTRETAERDIRSLYRTLAANLEQVKRLERAVDLTERNYELLRQDNRAGLASNLDVSQALATVYQTRRTRDVARYTVKSNYARLLAISARRTPAAPETEAPRAPKE
jgi:outer membrane protein